jgi:phage shock protein PspC (stress-responsive transcriptional regulator)
MNFPKVKNMSQVTAVEYTNPAKLDIESLTSAIIAGVVIGLVKKFTNENALVELGIGVAMFLLGPASPFGGFVKLAGIALVADGIYSLLKKNIAVSSAS